MGDGIAGTLVKFVGLSENEQQKLRKSWIWREKLKKREGVLGGIEKVESEGKERERAEEEKRLMPLMARTISSWKF